MLVVTPGEDKTDTFSDGKALTVVFLHSLTIGSKYDAVNVWWLVAVP
jgi:hypothetical protein